MKYVIKSKQKIDFMNMELAKVRYATVGYIYQKYRWLILQNALRI